MTAPAEVMFYEFGKRTLEQVLPVLLEKTLERGWRAVVQAGDQERLEVLDTALWTYSEESFLPHGTAKDGPPARQPVFLTAGEDNPNGAHVRFLAGGAHAASFEGYERVIYLFDGRSAEDKTRAREVWKEAKAKGHAVTYWQQTAGGKWEKKA
jgi:DNA polymerase-3 subunit chi